MRARLLLLFAVSAAPATAQQLRHLTPLEPWSVAYDTLRQRVVWAGHGDSGSYSYEWDGVAWHLTPDAGSRAGLLYFDAASDRLVSATETDPFGITNPALRLAERRGHDWMQANVPGGPSNRANVGFAYDEARGELLVFGGYDGATGNYLNDTWIFDGSAWTVRGTATAPSPRAFAALTYDSIRQRLVLFGGVDTIGGLFDTWEWDGATWTNVPTSAAPQAVYLVRMAFDAARARVVLCRSTPAEVWEYDGSNWSQRGLVPIPANTACGPLVYDRARGETLLIGFRDPGRGTFDGSVFAWNGTAWTPRLGLGLLPTPYLGPAAALDASGTQLLRLAGANPSTANGDQFLWAWNGSGWQLLDDHGPSERASAAMWSMVGNTFVFGGIDSLGSTLLDDTWQWNGTAWTNVPMAAHPAARSSAAVAVFPTLNRAMLFGGNVGAPIGDTWFFDGTAWTMASGGPQPAARYGHAMAYDPLRARVVMFGGYGVGQFGPSARRDTWEHDGTSWQQIGTGPTAVPGPRGSMAFDPVRQRIVYVDSAPGGPSFWEYDGTMWTQFAVDGDANSAQPFVDIEPALFALPSGRLTLLGAFNLAEIVATPAAAPAFGVACSADAPHLTARSLPLVGDASFALETVLAPANALIAIAGAEQSANVPFFGCTLLVAPGVATAFAPTDALGHAQVPLPIPNVASLAGLDLFFQAAAASTATANGFTLSRGLRVTVGR